jgi:hypothetical protein
MANKVHLIEAPRFNWKATVDRVDKRMQERTTETFQRSPCGQYMVFRDATTFIVKKMPENCIHV